MPASLAAAMISSRSKSPGALISSPSKPTDLISASFSVIGPLTSIIARLSALRIGSFGDDDVVCARAARVPPAAPAAAAARPRAAVDRRKRRREVNVLMQPILPAGEEDVLTTESTEGTENNSKGELPPLFS